jgi:hypothetical protein
MCRLQNASCVRFMCVPAAPSQALAKLCLHHLFPGRMSDPAAQALLSADASSTLAKREPQRAHAPPDSNRDFAAATSDVFERAGAVIAAAHAQRSMAAVGMGSASPAHSRVDGGHVSTQNADGRGVDGVGAFLSSLQLMEYLPALREHLGVGQSVDDLRLLLDSDLSSVGMKTVQIRRLRNALNENGRSEGSGAGDKLSPARLDGDAWDEYVTPDGFLYYHNVRTPHPTHILYIEIIPLFLALFLSMAAVVRHHKMAALFTRSCSKCF